MSQTVIQYVLSRLKDLGVTATFGCPGDLVYPVCDGIMDDPDIRWIGCANELNASYAAEGYARTKGVGVVVSTYGAGELCTFGGLAGAHAENSKVVSLTGMPGLTEWKGYRMHRQPGKLHRQVRAVQQNKRRRQVLKAPMVINSEEIKIMANKYLVTVSIIFSLFLAGCDQSHQQTMSKDFGNEVRTNTALQVINPEAGQEDMPPMALDGQKAEQALERYRTDTGEAETEGLIKGIGSE